MSIEEQKEMFFAAAIRQALEEELSKDERVVMFGEDIGTYGGAFGVTQGLLQKFGSRRIVDTPICENTIVGIAIGAALTGLRPIVEIMYMDFMLLAMDQIVNKAAKLRFIAGGQVSLPLTIRTAAGAGRCYGPDHSQSFEALCAHIPGLTVAYPSSAADAKVLLKAAISSNSPVIFIEHKALYGIRGPVPADTANIDGLGKAAVVAKGEKITVVSYGRMFHLCAQAVKELNVPENVVELIDLRTLKPWDRECVISSVRKTGRLLVVEETPGMCSIGSDVVSTIAEQCGVQKNTVRRLSALDLPIPFSPYLEPAVFPSVEKIRGSITEMVR